MVDSCLAALSIPIDFCLLLCLYPFCSLLLDKLFTGLAKDIDAEPGREIHPLMTFQSLDSIKSLLRQFEI